MKKVTVNNDQHEVVFVIAKVEEKYNAKFVGQLCLKDSHGVWDSDRCADIYYQAIPPIDGYSHYFALVAHGQQIYIRSGASAVDGIIHGVVADDGEIIYSKYRHHYRTSKDGSCFIDGGRDYVKTNRSTIGLKIIDGEWYQLEDEDYIIMKLRGEELV